MKEKSKFIEKFINTALITCCVVLYLLVFSTADIFFNNYNELDFHFLEVAPYLIIGSLVVILIISSVVSLLTEKVYNLIISLFLALFLLFWAETKFLYPDFGSLDGKIIDWNLWTGWTYIDLIIWIAVVAVSIYLKNHIVKHSYYICVIILITLSADFIIKYNNYASQSNYNTFTFDYRPIAHFSSKENVIVILLDEAQSDVFYELLKENPVMQRVFSGFTYYPDTVSGYSYTIPVIPLLYTGEFYDNSVPFKEYVNRAFSKYSVTKSLKNSGYRVDIFPKFVDYNYQISKDIADNVVEKSELASTELTIENCKNLLSLATFLNSPNIFRKYIYENYIFPRNQASGNNDGTRGHMHYWYQDQSFVNELEIKSKTVYEQPVFKYFHLRGAHVPWILDENGRPIARSEYTGSRNNYKANYIYSLKVLSDILKKLHEIGIYESSYIYIVSDHGAGRTFETRLIPDMRLENSSNKHTPSVPHIVKARAVPLYMVKKPNEKGNLRISNKPIALSDFPKIISEDLDLKHNELYSSIDNASERKYYYFNSVGLKTITHLPPLLEFKIDGDSWVDESWDGPVKINTLSGNYNRLFSVKLYDMKKCLSKEINTISTDAYELSFNTKNEYAMQIKKKFNNDLLVVASLNYSENSENISIDLTMNNKKRYNIRPKNPKQIINTPYHIMYFNKKIHNQSESNDIKFTLEGISKMCFKDVVNSINIFELETVASSN